jgi:hypothetical protein
MPNSIPFEILELGLDMVEEQLRRLPPGSRSCFFCFRPCPPGDKTAAARLIPLEAFAEQDRPLLRPHSHNGFVGFLQCRRCARRLSARAEARIIAEYVFVLREEARRFPESIFPPPEGNG